MFTCPIHFGCLLCGLGHAKKNTVLFHSCIRFVVSLYTVNGTSKSRAGLKYLYCIPDQSECISLQISETVLKCASQSKCLKFTDFLHLPIQ